MGTTEGDAVWDEWFRITRFLEGARLAFARESELWASLQIATPVRLKAATGRGTYSVDLEGHLAAVQDEETLFASVLIHSYALAESAAAARLSVSFRDFRGIEDWGERLLSAEGKSWDDLADGLPGAVEVAVVRNAFAHGTRSIDALDEKRMRKAGVMPLSAGDDVSLDYAALGVYRKRLRQLLGLGGIRRP